MHVNYPCRLEQATGHLARTAKIISRTVSLIFGSPTKNLHVVVGESQSECYNRQNLARAQERGSHTKQATPLRICYCHVQDAEAICARTKEIRQVHRALLTILRIAAGRVKITTRSQR